jgi:hypothetical protein
MSSLLDMVDEDHAGYRALEDHARAVTCKTVARHGGWVRLWLRALDLYYRGLRGTDPVEDPDEHLRIVRVTRMQFFALGLGHSQAVLDAAAAGNYHRVFLDPLPGGIVGLGRLRAPSSRRVATLV